jgi:hypothetical protein
MFRYATHEEFVKQEQRLVKTAKERYYIEPTFFFIYISKLDFWLYDLILCIFYNSFNIKEFCINEASMAFIEKN